jgi:Tfp pilus assembly protein PilF
MNHVPDRSDGTRRRFIVGVAGVLMLIGGAAVVVVFFVRPALELGAAEGDLDRHDPAAARSRLDRYLDRHPDDTHALLLAVRAARRSGDYADAERFLTALEERTGPTDASRLEWVLLGVQQGDFADQEQRLRGEAGRDTPDAPAILEGLARGYSANYRWPEAQDTLERLLKRNPEHALALLVRGALHDQLRNPKEAEADFRRAVELTPTSLAAHLALAEHLNRRGHTREAVQKYEWVLRSRPADPVALLGLARAYADAADLEAARRRLDGLLAAVPANVDALVERGRIELRVNRPDAAEPFLARAVQAAPWHREAHRLHLAALTDLGRTADADRCRDRIAQLTAEDGQGGKLMLRAHDNPGDVAVRWELWVWSDRNGNPAEGRTWLWDLLRTDPGHAGAHAALAAYFETAGQPRRAALHREKARPGGTGS